MARMYFVYIKWGMPGISKFSCEYQISQDCTEFLLHSRNRAGVIPLSRRKVAVKKLCELKASRSLISAREREVYFSSDLASDIFASRI